MTSITQPTNKTKRTFHMQWQWWVYLVLGLFLTAVIAFNVFQPITVLPRITLSPGFLFTNQNGETITSEDFRGQLTLYSFSYADCADNCAQPLTEMAKIKSFIESEIPEDITVSLVTISLDPENDTPEAMQTALIEIGEEGNGRVSWHFLSGDPTKTRYVVGGGFSTYYTEKEGQIEFDPHYYLVDGWGIIRAEYRHGPPELDVLERDINLVTEEVRNSDGAGRVAYEAAHLFACYPN